MDEKIFQKIVRIVGQDNCSRDLEELHCYSYDSSKQTFLPDAVALPNSTAQVAALVRLANEHLFPIVARGAGSGTTGGALPTAGGLVLSCARLNHILEIDSDNQIAIVEPGVITGEFQQTLKKHNLMYAPDPASLKFCTLGGNAAECAGGPSAIKYGVTKDSIIGLEVVLANGETLTTGTRTEKGVVGYDLTRLFIGSEGTLGIITKIITRLLPLPEHKETFLLQSSSLQKATELVAIILQHNILPCTLEYLDKTALRLVSDLLPNQPEDDIQAMLIIEIDGSRQHVEEQSNRLKTLTAEENTCTLQQATTEEDIREIWLARRSISQASFKLSPYKTSEDVVVPRNLIPELVHFCEDLAKDLKITILTFGHAGDGNIHVNIMAADGSAQESTKSVKAKTALFHKVISMGGSLSGEHGVGITKAPFISLELDKTSIMVMRQLKNMFDPKNIMNPGKIFPDNESNDIHPGSSKIH
ncbi:MAG: FAD-linked oxidase C-terminal domain-containing protein [Thermodesulfobacteriota bacterium]|nr:FAD-linked oxidase C-terminal domain-containing protein [Thermodesulfobacteriota bacterium]